MSWFINRSPASLGAIAYRRETGVHELIARDEDGMFHMLGLTRLLGPVFICDGRLGPSPWTHASFARDLEAGEWQIVGRVRPDQIKGQATVRVSGAFYLWRILRWPWSQMVDPHLNGQHSAVRGLWRQGRRGSALRWIGWSAAVTTAFSLLLAPLVVAGHALALVVGVPRAIARLGRELDPAIERPERTIPLAGDVRESSSETALPGPSKG